MENRILLFLYSFTSFRIKLPYSTLNGLPFLKEFWFSYEDLGQLNFYQYHRCSLYFFIKASKTRCFSLLHCQCNTSIVVTSGLQLHSLC